MVKREKGIKSMAISNFRERERCKELRQLCEKLVLCHEFTTMSFFTFDTVKDNDSLEKCQKHQKNTIPLV